MRAFPDVAVSLFPTHPLHAYLLKLFHSVSGGEGRQGRGTGTSVVMAGGRDTVY